MNGNLKTIYNNATRIVCKKSFSRIMLCQHSQYTPAMAAFLKKPDIVFNDPGNKILKAGNSSTVVQCQIDGHKFVVKRYNMKNPGHAIRRAFKKTRADISWRNARLLMKYGINTCEPVAMIEKRFGPFRNKAYFICKYIKGGDVLHYFKSAGAEERSRTAQVILGVFSRLESLMISHGDMKAANLIIQEGRLWLIDLDSMKQHKTKSGFSRARKKDLRIFMKNWSDQPDIAALFNRLKA